MDFTARAESAGATAKLMEYSEDAWVISTTFTFSLANAENRRMEVPVTPGRPLPWRVTRCMASMEEIPLIGLPVLFSPSLLMRVPGAAGLKVFLIRIGISFLYAG